MFGKKKTPEPVCGKCRLFNPSTKRCGVAILHEGVQHHLPVDADDECFFENSFVALHEDGELEHWKAEVQQVKWWVENPETGEKTDGDGQVRIEYPEGFFGEEDS